MKNTKSEHASPLEKREKESNQSMNIYRRELYHHGVMGMKWGKRNGPPYPLAPGQHSASEEKAGWRKSLKTVDKANLSNPDYLKTTNKTISPLDIKTKHYERLARLGVNEKEIEKENANYKACLNANYKNNVKKALKIMGIASLGVGIGIGAYYLYVNSNASSIMPISRESFIAGTDSVQSILETNAQMPISEIDKVHISEIEKYYDTYLSSVGSTGVKEIDALEDLVPTLDRNPFGNVDVARSYIDAASEAEKSGVVLSYSEYVSRLSPSMDDPLDDIGTAQMRMRFIEIVRERGIPESAQSGGSELYLKHGITRIYNPSFADARASLTLGVNADQLDARSMRAVYDYTSESTTINSMLRGTFDTLKGDSEKTTARIAELSRAFSKSKTATDTIVHRTVKVTEAEHLTRMFGLDARALTDKSVLERAISEGHTYVDKAYVSTSVSPMSMIGAGDGSGNFEIEIFCPKQTRAIYLGQLSRYPSEAELLIDRASKFKIVGGRFDQDTGKLSKLLVEIIGQG